MFEFLFKYPPQVFSRGHFVFLTPWPVWLLIALVLIAAGGLFWHVRRHGALMSRMRSVAIWMLETALIALLLALLWHPAISVATLKPKQNVIALLVDGSRSMGVRDENGRSREDEAKRVLDSGLLANIEKRFQVRFYRVGADLTRTSRDQLFAPPNAPVTRIGRSLESLAAEASSLPFGAAVLLSDGAENSGGIDLLTMQKLRQSRVPVNTIGFGRERLTRDVEVEDFYVPQRALAGSRIEARVALRQNGVAGEKTRVTILDGDRALASREVTFDREASSVNLVFDAGKEGALNLVARVDPLPGEENLANNAVARVVNVSGRKPRILYVEGEPRWEYKFMRRAADEDSQIELVSMLRTTPNKIYRQGVKDAGELADGFPTKPEELFAYDGLIIGSVESSWFTAAQQQMVRDFAERRGGGVLFMAGRFGLSDGGYAASQLAAMLPVHLPSSFQTFQRVYSTAELAPSGYDAALTRLVDDPAQNIEKWKKMPEMANWQLVGDPKPGATLLAYVNPPGHRKSPLLVTEPYGRGRTAVIATAGMWRWQMRSEHTDKTLATFWRQMLRWLVSDTPGEVSAVTPRQVLEDEDQVKLRVEVRDKTYQPLSAARVNAHFIGPEGLSETMELNPLAGEEGVYGGTWTAGRPGAYLAEIHASGPGGDAGSDVVTFRRDDGIAENFRTTQNRDLLEKLSSATGGRYYTAGQARQLADEIEYSEAGLTTRETLDLWDLPIVLLLAVALRASEWVLRRKWGAV